MKNLKRIRENIWRILSKKRWLAAALGLVFLYLVGILWYETLNRAVDNENSVRARNEVRLKSETRRVCYYEDGAYLVNGQGQKIAGPYPAILEDWEQEEQRDLYETPQYYETNLTRYVNAEGRYGYLNVLDGTIALQAVYTVANVMEKTPDTDTAQALVSDGSEYYRIDQDGNRLTEGHYINWVPLQNGYFCGKLKEKNTWSLLDAKENPLLEGCQSIGAPTEECQYGTAMRDGKRLLLRGVLAAQEDETRLEILGEYENFNKIEYYEEEGYALIRNADNLWGVLSLRDGAVLVEPQYAAISGQRVQNYVSDTEQGQIVQFLAKKSDGKTEIINWNPDAGE